MGRIDYILSPRKLRKDLKKEQKELQEEVAEVAAKSKHLPKEFKYYCPACLYQTNEEIKRCPKCGYGVLKSSE